MTHPDVLHTIEELEQHYDVPGQASRSKASTSLTRSMQNWLAHCPFFVLSTFSDQGIDCSPRGDRAGEAFRILDDNTIAIPDRRGNNRIDTLRNLVNDPRIGLLFLVPGVEEALRIKGKASISINQTLRNSFVTDNESPPATVIVITVLSAYVQNARAVRRSRLWESAFHTAASDLPDSAELTRIR